MPAVGFDTPDPRIQITKTIGAKEVEPKEKVIWLIKKGEDIDFCKKNGDVIHVCYFYYTKAIFLAWPANLTFMLSLKQQENHFA